MFNKDSRLQFDHSLHSPHTLVLHLIKPKSSVLDVGCNDGYVGQKLIKFKQCIVDGIDIDQKLLNQVQKKGYEKTFNIDLYQSNFKLKDRYDYILLLDILEHLPNPQKILHKFVKQNLKPSGRVLISIPNIARFEIRLKLLFGQFNYTPSGILHEDHLRHFTLKTGQELIQNSGLKIEKIIPTGLGHRLHLFPTLTAFQFLYDATKK